MNEVKQTRKEALEAAIKKLPIDDNFKVPPGFMIPLKKSVIVKPVTQGAITTEAGIVLAEAAAKNTQRPNIGIIYAVGPDVDENLFPGLKVYVNQYADLEVTVKGRPYLMMEESSIYGIITPDTWMYVGVKPDKQVIREKLFERQVGFTERHHTNDQNEKDKKMDKTKGKIRKV